jgi:hypothetical protein
VVSFHKSLIFLEGLLGVRTDLRQSTPPAPGWWRTTHCGSTESSRDPQLSGNVGKWLLALADKSDWIGLRDLGNNPQGILNLFGQDVSRENGRIGNKDRLTKNMLPNMAPPNQNELAAHLALPSSVSAAQAYATWDSAKKRIMDKWIVSQFWRRTSKLGMDFGATQLANGVKMNVAGSVDYLSANPSLSMPTQFGLMDSSREKDLQKQNRAITISELRHGNKQLSQIPHYNLQFYSEIRQSAQPLPPLLVQKPRKIEKY